MGNGRSSERRRPKLGTASIVAAMAFSLVALGLVSDRRYDWLTIGAGTDQGYGYGYEPPTPTTAPPVDLSAQLNIDGPTVSRAGRKAFAVDIANSSVEAVAVDPSVHVDVTVSVNGTEIGEVGALSAPVTISPGDAERLQFQWLYSGLVSRGATVVYSVCVDFPGDIDDSDDCSQESVVAR